MCTKLEKISSGRRWCTCGSLHISSRSENDCQSSSHHFSVPGMEKEERKQEYYCCSTIFITFLSPGSFKRVEDRKNIDFSASIEDEVEEGWKFQLGNLQFCHMWVARTWKSHFIASTLVFLRETPLPSKTSKSIRMFSLLFGTQIAWHQYILSQSLSFTTYSLVHLELGTMCMEFLIRKPRGTVKREGPLLPLL